MVEYQQYFHREINLIRQEIYDLKVALHRQKVRSNLVGDNTHIEERNYQPSYLPPVSEQSSQTYQPPQQEYAPQNQEPTNFNQKTADKPFAKIEKSNLEKIIGENLVSLIGIAITILGVGIGAKYAIERDLISPSVRILLGYLFGIGLLFFAVRLRSKYLNFSAVLFSGATAIMYFITFAAYSYYALIPQYLAFALMFFLTDVAVGAALKFNRQVIAHVGLVGAYAIPFLLGGDSGNFAVLFGYIAIINVGILAISIKKYWKSLFYSSFVFTWATYAGWHLTSYRGEDHFSLAFLFLSAFFLIFYTSFLAYKLISKEKLGVENVSLLLANSFVFYGFGYSLLRGTESGGQFLGLFTVFNALTHLAVGFAIRKLGLAGKDVFDLLTALFLIFNTIAIPVQLDGNWVTLLWTAQAAILFWIGRSKNYPLYERFSFPPMILASLSLLRDWLALLDKQSRYEDSAAVIPVFNVYFLTAILFAAAFAFVHFLNKDERYKPAIDDSPRNALFYAFPATFLIALYVAFGLEINNYWHLQIVKTAFPSPADTILMSGNDFKINNDLNLFHFICQIDYAMLFLTTLALVNIGMIKNYVLGIINLMSSAFVLLIFLTAGLFVLGELRESYLQQTEAGIFYILIRYFSFVFLAGLIYSWFRYTKEKFIAEQLPSGQPILAFDFVFYVSLLCLASSELINWLDILGNSESYKLALSIFWGLYSLFLIGVGIWKNKKHLRIGAFVLFAATLTKLFFYDIVELDTISKTIVFVSLGVSLLVISFLYHKYKNLIFEESENENLNFNENL
jgi:uncharacterized membrane protein